MCDYILKVRQYWICNGKEAKHFYFSNWRTPHIQCKGKARHIAWLSSLYSKYSAFIEMKMTLHLMTNTIEKEKGTICGFGNILEER